MPEVQNLHLVGRLADFVINQYRRVNKLEDTRASSRWGTNIGKALEEVDVIQDCVAESLCALGKLRPGVGEDFLKIR